MDRYSLFVGKDGCESLIYGLLQLPSHRHYEVDVAAGLPASMAFHETVMA
jgi:hypothetical protein